MCLYRYLWHRAGHARWFTHLIRDGLVPVDRRLYWLSKGRVSVAGPALFSWLLLTTTGRRSGLPRTTPLVYVADGDRVIVTTEDFGMPGGRPPGGSTWRPIRGRSCRSEASAGAAGPARRPRTRWRATGRGCSSSGRRWRPIAGAAACVTCSCWSPRRPRCDGLLPRGAAATLRRSCLHNRQLGSTPCTSRSGPTSPARGATSASAASRPRSPRSSTATRCSVTWRSFELDPSAPPSARATAPTHLAAQVRHEPRAGARDARAHDRDGRRGRARLPLRPRARRQHVRRAPPRAPRRGARRAGRDEGAPDARVPHRGRADERPRDARAPRDGGRPARRRGARHAGHGPLRGRRPRRRADRHVARHQRRAVLRRRPARSARPARSPRRCSASCCAAPGPAAPPSRSSPAATPAASTAAERRRRANTPPSAA